MATMGHQAPKGKRCRALAALGLVAFLSASYLWAGDAGPSLSRAEEQLHILESSAFDPRRLGGSDGKEAVAAAQGGDVLIVDHNYKAKHSRRKKEYYETSPLSEEEDMDNVVASIPGTWRPQPDCPVPRVLLLLYGQLRSFSSTHKHHARMADQASNGCYFIVAVTDEEICDADPSVPGRCLDGPLGQHKVWWDRHADVTNVHDAERLINATRATFRYRMFASVYQSRLENKLNYLEKVHYLWGVRMEAAVRNVAAAFASNGTPLDPEGTVLIRSRFDILPQTFPFFDWEEIGPRGGLFQDLRGNAIVYAGDFHDCQPDLHMYTSLRGFFDLLVKSKSSFTGQTPCRSSDEVEQIGPLIMDDDWQICRRNILRTSLSVPLPEEGLKAIPVGKNRRLYCNCRPDMYRPTSAEYEHFECFKRFSATFSYSGRVTSLECPVALAGGGGKCPWLTPIGGGPGCTDRLPCDVGHTHNIWFPRYA